MDELWAFTAFFMLKATFSKRQLVKISMTCVYIKLDVKKKKKKKKKKCWRNKKKKKKKKKKDAVTITTNANESCKGWLRENYYFMGKEWHFW